MPDGSLVGGDAFALAVDSAPPGALLLLPGHVMLYLGIVGGIPFAIHDLWQYRHPEGAETMVGQITVSALPVEPGQEGKTLLERLTTARQISG